MKFAKFAAGGAICAALLGFGAVTATQAAAVESSAATVQAPIQQGAYWEEYYENYFLSNASCVARGNSVTNPSSPQYIPGSIRFECYVRKGEGKWTMAILRCDCRVESGDTRRPMSVL
ncbi:hypothetical protein [Amycolatopsis albispora]|uniref:Secreted protein n=1 Tax=Amycolatopsis albispora TaxID=1804986 RepID=A0A344L0V2_9PSEU|nr:hypothetical protein [Amycolatopsis albispora]AXB41676.1 hypothetical protein A4R43_03380 [Amycolatopsis albispora]